MATYRQIHTSFWQDPFILDLTPEEKYFYLYLMTNTKTTACGVYELPKKIIELETGYNRESVEKLLNRFIEYGKIKYSEETKEIIILNWLKYNNWKSPKTQTCIYKELKEVKNKDYISIIDSFFSDKTSPSDGVSMPHRSPIEVIEKEMDKEKDKDKEIEEKFNLFYSEYPIKKSKESAKKKFISILKEDINLFPVIMDGLKSYKQEIEYKKTEDKFIKHPSTWLNNNCWEDEYNNQFPEKVFTKCDEDNFFN